jgi:hypothetical protein
LDTPGFSVSDLVFGEFARDYSGNVRRCFDDANVWPVLERNELLPDLANSFLVIASVETEGNALDRNRESLAFKYSTFRRRPYATATTFARKGDGGIAVTKSLLDPAAAASEPPSGAAFQLAHRVGSEPYVAGTLFAREFSKAVGRGHGLLQLAALLTPWIRLLLDRAAPLAGSTQAATAWSARNESLKYERVGFVITRSPRCVAPSRRSESPFGFAGMFRTDTSSRPSPDRCRRCSDRDWPSATRRLT